jgi:isoleucyl-tRNA synthetase
VIGSSLEATIEIQLTESPISSVGEDVSRSQGLGPDQDQDHHQQQQFNDRHHKISAWSLDELLGSYADELKSLFITSDVSLTRSPSGATSGVDLPNIKDTQVFTRDVLVPGLGACRMVLRRATMHKCPRCWTFTSVEVDTLCARCVPVVAALQP